MEYLGMVISGKIFVFYLTIFETMRIQGCILEHLRNATYVSDPAVPGPWVQYTRLQSITIVAFQDSQRHAIGNTHICFASWSRGESKSILHFVFYNQTDSYIIRLCSCSRTPHTLIQSDLRLTIATKSFHIRTCPSEADRTTASAIASDCWRPDWVW